MPNPEDSLVAVHIDGKLHGTGLVTGKGEVATCLHVISTSFMEKPYTAFGAGEEPARLKIEVDYQGKKLSREAAARVISTTIYAC